VSAALAQRKTEWSEPKTEEEEEKINLFATNNDAIKQEKQRNNAEVSS